jgi:hypothetical protein
MFLTWVMAKVSQAHIKLDGKLLQNIWVDLMEILPKKLALK